jgi:hypothetical protein
MEKYWEDFKTILTRHHKLSEKAFNNIKEKYLLNKYDLLKYFGEEGKIKINLDISEKQPLQGITNIIDKIMRISFPSLCDKYGLNLAEYQKLKKYMMILFNSVAIEELKSNKLLFNKKMTSPASELKAGAKTSKWFSHLPSIEHYNINTPKDTIKLIVDSIYSIIRAKLIIKKDLNIILSLNPMDFLFASAHTTGWRSCHSFIDGEFCTGWLSYMLDNVSLIAYAYSRENNFEISKLKYPIKQWRQMVFVDLNNKAAVFGRQYPNENVEIAKNVRKLTGYLLADIFDTPKKWYAKGVLSITDNEDNDSFFSSNISYGEFNYRDPYTTMIKIKEGGKDPVLKLGSDSVPCFECGESRNDNALDKYYCPSCREDTYTCDECGRQLSEQECYIVNESVFCETCFNELCTYCNHCGNTIYKEDATYVEEADEYVCDRCLNDYYYQCDHCENYTLKTNCTLLADTVDTHYCENCIDNYAHYCDKCENYVLTVNTVYINEYGDSYIEENWCDDCVEEAHRCNSCGNLFEELSDSGLCKHCEEEKNKKIESEVAV